MAKKLSPKQRLFVAEYCKDYNATQAAIRAGYSQRTARSQGQRLLTNVDIQVAIERRQQKTEERADVEVDDVVAELVKIAFSNLLDLADWTEHGVRLKPSKKLTRDQAAAIAEVKEDVDKFGNRTVSIKQHQKLSALAHLGKHLGMFSEKLDEKVQDAVEEVLSEIGARLPAEVYTQVVDAVRDALGVPPMGGNGGPEAQPTLN